jgi:hypothetical protein
VIQGHIGEHDLFDVAYCNQNFGWDSFVSFAINTEQLNSVDPIGHQFSLAGTWLAPFVDKNGP